MRVVGIGKREIEFDWDFTQYDRKITVSVASTPIIEGRSRGTMTETAAVYKDGIALRAGVIKAPGWGSVKVTWETDYYRMARDEGKAHGRADVMLPHAVFPKDHEKECHYYRRMDLGEHYGCPCDWWASWGDEYVKKYNNGYLEGFVGGYLDERNLTD